MEFQVLEKNVTAMKFWSHSVIAHSSGKVETNRLEEADEIWYQYKYEVGKA
jgi:hypothetical protein